MGKNQFEKGKFSLKSRKIVIRFNAPVIMTFALFALIATFLGLWTDGDATYRYFSVYRSPLTDALTYLRFFTHVLGHEGYSHYMGNMLLLLLVGPSVEDRYGHSNTLWFIVATALVTGLVQFIFFPTAMLMGASGVVFMMILLASMGGSRGGGIPLTMVVVAIFYLGGEVAAAISVRDNISQLSHILGGVCGAAMGFYLASKGR